MNSRISIGAIIVLAAVLTGCETDDDAASGAPDLSGISISAPSGATCYSEIKKAKQIYGSPSDVDRFQQGDYHSDTYWWDSAGVSKTFTWGGPVDGCRVSTYTFNPF